MSIMFCAIDFFTIYQQVIRITSDSTTLICYAELSKMPDTMIEEYKSYPYDKIVLTGMNADVIAAQIKEKENDIKIEVVKENGEIFN